MTARAALLLGLHLSALTPPSSFAAWLLREDVPGVIVSDIGTAERALGATSDGRGGAIVVWWDEANGIHITDIPEQRIKAPGLRATQRLVVIE